MSVYLTKFICFLLLVFSVAESLPNSPKQKQITFPIPPIAFDAQHMLADKSIV